MKALITGASTGIGLELALLLAEKKYNLVLVARSMDRLKKVKMDIESKYGVNVDVYKTDLAQSGSAEKLYDDLKRDGHAFEVVINNAGFGYAGPFTAMSVTDLKEMIELNMTTLSVLTYLYSKDMVKKNSGRIMNVASMAAYQPGPLMAAYYATKAYVLNLSEALHQELKDQGVTITSLCPGPTETEFGKRAQITVKKLAVKEFFSLSAKDVAQRGLDGLFSGKKVVIPGVANNLLVQSNRIVPRGVVMRLLKSLHTKAMRH